MDNRISISFFILILIQGLHSMEEYLGRLWEVFPPAKFLCSLVSSDLEQGFLIINIGLFLFGLWCWLVPVRRNYAIAPGLIVFWIIIELINGVGHPVWSLYRGGYEPGVATALLLGIVALYLARQLTHSNPRNEKALSR